MRSWFFDSGAAAAGAVSFVGTGFQTTGSPDFTVTDLAAINPGAGHLVLGIGGDGQATGRFVSTVVVDSGGPNQASAALVVEIQSAGTGVTAQFYDVTWPGGVLGNIVVTYDGTQNYAALMAWIVTDTTGVAHATGTHINSEPMDADLNVPAGGVVIGYGINDSSATSTWTGATENDDRVVETTTNHSGASLAYAAAQTPLTVTDDLSAAATNCALVCVSYPPA